MRAATVFGLILVLLLNVAAFAQEEDTATAEPDTIAWYSDYDSALTAASKDGNYILMEFYTGW
jgi:hypothetical protein